MTVKVKGEIGVNASSNTHMYVAVWLCGTSA